MDMLDLKYLTNPKADAEEVVGCGGMGARCIL